MNDSLRVKLWEMDRCLDEMRREFQQSKGWTQSIPPQVAPHSPRAFEKNWFWLTSTFHYWKSLMAAPTQLSTLLPSIPGCLSTTPRTLWCHAFSMILRVLVREWYTLLKPLSVGSFTQLVKEFKLYFFSNVRPRSSIMMLLGLKQGEEEVLSNFVARFTSEL